MAIEVTDVRIEKQSASAPLEELSEEGTMEQQQPQPPAAVAAPRGRGRPLGSKDRQPRKRQAPLARREAAASFARGQRPVRAASPDDLEEEEEPQPARPLTRRSTARPKPARRRVQRVEESEEEEEEAETPPPSPRTRRHQEWAAYRQQKADAHQTNVNHYARLFDRMLA